MLRPRRGVRGELGVARAFSARVEVLGSLARRGGRVAVLAEALSEDAIAVTLHLWGLKSRLELIYFMIFVGVGIIFTLNGT